MDSKTIQTPWLLKSYSAEIVDASATLKQMVDEVVSQPSIDLVPGPGITIDSAAEIGKDYLYVSNSLVSGTNIVAGSGNLCVAEDNENGLIIGEDNSARKVSTGNKHYTVLGASNVLEDNLNSFVNGYGNTLSAYYNSMLNGNANSADRVNYTIVNGQVNKLNNVGYSLVAGNDNKLSAAKMSEFNVVFGNSNDVADGNYNYVYGQQNEIDGTLNEVLGARNNIQGDLNFAVGSGHNAVGAMNMLLGVDNSAVSRGADGKLKQNVGSILMGQKLTTSAPYQIIMGNANDPTDRIVSVYNSNSECYNDPNTTTTVSGVNYVWPMFVLAGDSYPKDGGGNKNSHTIYKDGQILLRFDDPDYAVNGKYPMTEVLINEDYFKRASADAAWIVANKDKFGELSAAIVASATALTDAVDAVDGRVTDVDSKVGTYAAIKDNSAKYDDLVRVYGPNSADYANVHSAARTYSADMFRLVLDEGSNLSFTETYDANNARVVHLSARTAGEPEKFTFSGDASIDVVKEYNEDEGQWVYTLNLPEAAQTQVSAKPGDPNISVEKGTDKVVYVGLQESYTSAVDAAIGRVASDLETVDGKFDDYYNRTQVDRIVGDLSGFAIVPSGQELPPAAGAELNKIYLLQAVDSQGESYYKEWISNGKDWTRIDPVDVDMSSYYTKTESDSRYIGNEYKETVESELSRKLSVVNVDNVTVVGNGADKPLSAKAPETYTLTGTSGQIAIVDDPDSNTTSIGFDKEFEQTIADFDKRLSAADAFVATYNETTYADVKEAYEAGRPCFAKRDESVYVLSQVNSDSFMFSNIRGHDDLIRVLTVSNDDSWTVSSNKQFQQKLTAGNNITIEGNVISAKSGDIWVEDGGDLSEIGDTLINMYEYHDSTYTGYKPNVTIVANDVEHSMLKLFNDGTESMNVTVLTDKTLFGAGNRITDGYGYTIKDGCALFLRVNGKCLIASYSNGNPGSSTQEQAYTDEENPIDSLALSTSFSNTFKAGVERLGDTIGSFTTTFSNAIRNGVEKLNDSLGNLGITFSNSIEPGFMAADVGNLGITFSNSIIVENEE